MKKKGIITLGIGALAVVAAIFAGTTGVKAKTTEKINEGVYIGSINVGGMTATEAKDAVNSYVESLMNTTFTLHGVEGSMEVTAEDMGILADIDAAVDEAISIGHSGNLISRYKSMTDLKKNNIVIPMDLSIDRDATAMAIYEKSDELNQEAVDATLTREDGSFVIIPGQIGQQVNIVESVYAIDDYLSKEWDGIATDINLVVETVQPRGTEEELSKVQDVLGKFSTDFSSSASGRAKNVKNGCSKINGTLIYPGEEFSVYKAVSPFTENNGYELAGSYQNGTTVETFGGGICQVSTTLYNAVIRAELEVVMRFNHSMIVGYVDPSADAAISGEYKDFRFKNNTDAPIYIQGITDGGIISFTIYGQETRPENRTVKFVSETISEEEGGVEFKLDDTQPIGYLEREQSAHRGVEAKLWKVVYVNDVEESRDLFNRSTYKKSPKILVVGTKDCPSDYLGALKAACQGDDESAVRAAIAAAKAAKDKPAEPEPQPEPSGGGETKPDPQPEPSSESDGGSEGDSDESSEG